MGMVRRCSARSRDDSPSRPYKFAIVIPSGEAAKNLGNRDASLAMT